VSLQYKIEQIRNTVESEIQLPALPAVAMEVVDLIDNPRTSASKLGKVISTDQALTAKVLRIANSPFYGFPRKIATIDFAIIVLGFDAVKEVVISLSLMSALQRRSDEYFDTTKFWDHSITCGVAARRLARDLGYRVSGEAFVGGLLHDIGMPIFHRYFNQDFREAVRIHRETGISFYEAEKSVIGVTHQEIGGWLAERWNLPPQLTDVIINHHRPNQADVNKELVALIHLSDVMCQKMNLGTSAFDFGIEFDVNALQTLRFHDASYIDTLVEKYKSIFEEDLEKTQHFGD
jgi:putative nucleotidyltransferase with HDIG domain